MIFLKYGKAKFDEYVYYLEHPKKMLYTNFMGGMARGFGMAIGFTLLGAVAVYLLQIVVKWKLPVIARLLRI
jgi:hypothetical protein